MELSGDEQDSLAANCGKCWAYPGNDCWIMKKDKKTGHLVPTSRTRRHPHPERVDRASRRGILGGAGRDLLEQNRKIDG